jgi:release factor glutamine methyltransferase
LREQQSIPTIDEAIADAAGVLRGACVGEARREAGSLLAHVINRDRTFLITHGNAPLTSDDLARFQALIARRAAGEPFQYITGHQEFYGLDFEVTSDVLIPRPETELIIETALYLLNEKTAPLICDVGTGSGCIAVTLLHECADARAVALDISTPAISIAARNAARHNVGGRLSLVLSDCFAALNPADELFTIIVSNPPYIAESHLAGLQREVRDHEPRVALTPGGDGLGVIRRLLHDAPQFLVAGGHLVFEIGIDQHEAVAELIDTRVWTLLDVHKDLQGIPRTVSLCKNKV